MTPEELDELIKSREQRIEKRKEQGNLFEIQVEEEKKRLQTDRQTPQNQSELPPCPQCGETMELIPNRRMIVCRDCGIGTQI